MNRSAERRTQITNLSEPAWQLSPDNVRLKENEVHVWLARLDRENIGELEDLLSDDERERAGRFRFETDRKQFIRARGLLRKMLAGYLPAYPSQLCFEYNQHGKPYLSGPWRSNLKFNLSHSGNLALYAFTFNREIGIDLEQVKPAVIDEGMLSLCLTELEIKYFRTLTEEERNQYFFTCWTSKEAFLKACGNGLSLSPNKIEAALLDKYPTSFFDGSVESPQIYLTFPKLPALVGYTAALAVEGHHPLIKFYLSKNLRVSR